jgi:hypothetical protein
MSLVEALPCVRLEEVSIGQSDDLLALDNVNLPAKPLISRRLRTHLCVWACGGNRVLFAVRDREDQRIR